MDLKLENLSEEDRNILSVAGEVDVYTAPQLRDKLRDLSQDGKTLIVDLSEVGFLDSTGLGVLVGANKNVSAKGGDFKLISPSEKIRKLFQVTRLVDIFPVYSSREEALAS